MTGIRVVAAFMVVLWFVLGTSLSFAGDDNLACVQTSLSALGFDAGPADGIMGRRTSGAAEEFVEAEPVSLPPLSIETSGEWCVVLAAMAPNFTLKSDGVAAFWRPPASTYQCGGRFSWTKPFELAVKLVRQPFPNDHSVNFAHHFGRGLSRTMAGTDVQEFKNYILDVARAKTFTEVDMQTRWSPIYVQSNLVRLIAMYVTYMETTGQLSETEREVLIDWGTPMIPGQIRREQNGSADSRAASGVALISWGAVTGDRDLMQTGYDRWNEALPYVIDSIGRLRRHPSHRWVPTSSLSLEDEYNLTLAHAIEGAAILENLGVDAFQLRHKGRTLHDAVDWWAGVIAEEPPAFQGFRRASHNWHVAWIPIYLSKYPDRPVADILRPIARSVSQGKRPMFEGVSLGGPTDCFWN